MLPSGPVVIPVGYPAGIASSVIVPDGVMRPMRGHAATVALTAGDALPDPASLTNDAQDLDWIAAAGLDLGAQSSERVVNLLLEAAGFRRFHLRKTEGVIRTALQAHDGASSVAFDFTLAKQRTENGRVRIVIAPVRT